MPHEAGRRPYVAFLLPICLGFLWTGLPTANLCGQERLKAAYEAAQQLFQLGQDEQARTRFQALLVRTYRERAALYAQQGNWARAQDDLKTALAMRAKDPALRYELAYAYFRLGKCSEAARTLEPLLRTTPAGSQAGRPLEEAFSSRNDRKAGGETGQRSMDECAEPRLSSLRAAFEELPRSIHANIWQEASPPAEPTSDQKQLLEVYGQVLASTHNYLALIAVRQGRFSEAARNLARLRDLQPDFPEVEFNLGLALFQAERYAEALEPLERATAQNPSNLKAKKYLGLAHEQLEHYDQAIRLLAEVRPSLPDDPQVLLALGTALTRSGRPEEARQVFIDLLKTHSDSAFLHVVWGQAYAAQHQQKEAEREFRRALELDPLVPSAHFYLGVVDFQRGQLEAAKQEFEAEIASHPRDLRARYHLAYILLTQRKIDQALSMLRQVIQENPSYEEAHYTLGKALLAQGSIKEAIHHLETAARLDPKKVNTHYLLGRAYLHAGKREDAQREFQITQNLKNQRKSESPGGEDPNIP